LTIESISFSHNSSYRICWLNILKGILTPLTNTSLSKGQAQIPSSPHSFLDSLFKQPEILNLLQTNYSQHQANLIHHNLNNLENQDNLINQLFTANPLSISTHNTRNISDTTKYAQLLETLSLHNIDICGVTEMDYFKLQKAEYLGW